MGVHRAPYMTLESIVPLSEGALANLPALED